MEKSSGFAHNHLRQGGVYVFVLFLAIAAVIACLPHDAAAAWTKRVIDGGYIEDPSISVDSNGHVHMSMVKGGRLFYINNSTGKMVKRALDNSGNVDWYTSIAVDNGGKVHIAYCDRTHASLKYVTNASGSWVKTTVDNSANIGWYNSIAIDSGGKVHISYYVYTTLRYATNAIGAWMTGTVDNSGMVGFFTSIALDSSGKVLISYYDVTNSALKYATGP